MGPDETGRKSEGAKQGNRRRRKRPNRSTSSRKKSRGDGVDPVQVLQASQQPAVKEDDKEAPLSRDEVARLKAAFRFLRQHRQLLKLRVNAQEDLLLNGKRDPTHRGVCQHLLAKVDKTRVLQASERLPAAEATRLLAGVIGFSPELPYVLRFLECVRASSGQKEAATALTSALSNIDFDDASSAQIRQLLTLICDVFDQRELPVFLLGLLQSAPFRKAFDRGSEDFPESLARLLVPLREVHRLVDDSRKHKSGSNARLDPELLSQGALLLLRVNHESLLGLKSAVRKKLFLLLCDLGKRGDWPPSSSEGASPPTKALLALYGSLHLSPDDEAQATLDLCSLLLQSDREREARRLLRDAANAARGPVRAELDEHLQLLDQPRVGPIALSPRARRDKKRPEPEPATKSNSKPQAGLALPPSGRFYSGVHLYDRRKVRVVYADEGQGGALSKNLEIWKKVLLPQVQLPIAFDVQKSALRPFLAVEHLGQSLIHRLRHAGADECRRLLLDLCRLKTALDAWGAYLPDGDPGRFSVDPAGHLWLSDLSEVTTQPAADWLKDALTRAEKLSSTFSLSAQEHEALKQANDPLAIAGALRLL